MSRFLVSNEKILQKALYALYDADIEADSIDDTSRQYVLVDSDIEDEAAEILYLAGIKYALA